MMVYDKIIAWSRKELPIILGFVIIWIIVTWPMLISIFKPTLGHGDFYTFSWGLWWIKAQALSLSNPWYTDQVFAPVGSMLAYHTLMPLPNLVLIPFALVVGEVSALKLSLIFIFPLIAYTTYKVGLRCSISKYPAIIAGIIYSFSPILMQRTTGHFNMIFGALVLPLALLFAMRYANNQKLYDALIYGTILGLSTYIEPRSALFAVFLSFPYLILKYAMGKTISKFCWLRGIAAAIVLAFVLSVPQLWMMYRQNVVEHYDPNAAWLSLSYVYYSNDLNTVIAPTINFFERLNLMEAMNTFNWNKVGEGFLQNFGLGTWILIIIGFIWTRHKFIVKYLGAIMIISIILSLGPHIRIAGAVYTPLEFESYGSHLSLLMPFTWLTRLPVLSEVRISSLYLFLAILPAALLAGFGFKALLKSPMKNAFKIPALIVIVGLVLIESGTTMTYKSDRPIEIPRIYEKIKNDQSSSIVVDVPLLWIDSTKFVGTLTNTAREPMFRATQHEHPIAYGNLSRISEEKWAALVQNRFYTDLITLESRKRKDIYQPAPNSPQYVNKRLALDNAKKLEVGWIVIWPQAGKRVVSYIRKMGFTEVARDSGMQLFKSPFKIK